MNQDDPIDPDRWIDDHGDALYAYAILRLRDPEATSEVIQETFLEALKARGRFQGRSSERTWLVGILKHKLIDRYRSKARRERTAGWDEAHELDLEEFFDRQGGWRDRIQMPELSLERSEFWEVFRLCLSELPESYAEAFTLSELEGMSGPEICKILEITPTNLWARLHRARLHLRKSLEARWFKPDA